MNQNPEMSIRDFILRVVISGITVGVIAMVIPPIHYEKVTGLPRYFSAAAVWMLATYLVTGKLRAIVTSFVVPFILCYGVGGGLITFIVLSLFGIDREYQLPLATVLGTAFTLWFFYIDRCGTPNLEEYYYNF